jgi:hypothetical protein
VILVLVLVAAVPELCWSGGYDDEIDHVLLSAFAD